MARVIVAGSRTFTDQSRLDEILTNLDIEFGIETIVCGEAKGADLMGKAWGVSNRKLIHSFPAQWDRYGRGAGFKRNIEMSRNADMLVAFWDNKSKGTKHMIDTALAEDLVVFVEYF